MIGVGAAYALYKMFFGVEPANDEEALNAVREYVSQLELDAEEAEKKNRFRKNPGQGDFQKIKAMNRLKQLKKQRNKN